MSRMHIDEVKLSVEKLREMLNQQFPEFMELPLTKLDSFGTTNVIYRLGDQYIVRLPMLEGGVYQLEKEKEWLPKLAGYLPLKIPTPLAVGEPTEYYPFIWGIYEWIAGENVVKEKLKNISESVGILCEFIKALHKVDLPGGPNPSIHNFHRGEELMNRNERTCNTIDRLKSEIDAKIALEVWKKALSSEMQVKDKAWIHGDIQSGNILMQNGKISSIIDFGGLGYGDKACDMMVAWNFLDRSGREEFRKSMQVNDDLWDRGRGWALTVSLIAYNYYKKTNLGLAKISKYTIDEIEKEYKC